MGNPDCSPISLFDSGSRTTRKLAQTNLLCVQGIIQAQASHSPDVLKSQWRQEETDIRYLIRDLVRSEDISLNYASVPSLGYICNAIGQYGVSVVSTAISGQEPHETLWHRRQLSTLHIGEAACHARTESKAHREG